MSFSPLPLSQVFPAKSNARSSSGLLQWGEKRLATDAICLVNHICVRLDGKIVKPSESRSSGKNSPFIIKFCFSAAPIVWFMVGVWGLSEGRRLGGVLSEEGGNVRRSPRIPQNSMEVN